MAEPLPILLFMCVANSSRSQMAEALARHMALAGVEVWSAGSEPSRVNPFAVQALAELGIASEGARSKSVDEVPQQRVKTVITLCAEEVCPVFAGNVERLHWPLPDPAGVEGSDEDKLACFRKLRDEIRARLQAHFSS